MKQKLISFVSLLLFFVGFGYFFGDEYWDFQNKKTQEESFFDQNTEHLETFSLEALPLLGEDTELLITPNLGLLDDIVEEMEQAQEKIYVEVYIFTEKRMREALIAAHRRGVEVKVLLENNPYKAPSLNDETFKIFQEQGIDVRWSDPLLYSLNHSKLLMIDEFAYIATGNFSYSLFKHNRDFLLRINNPLLYTQLQTLFLGDYAHTKSGVIGSNLVISPYSSRQKLEQLLLGAQSSIDFYFPYLQDERLENILFEKAQQGINIRGIVEESFYNQNPELIEKYKKVGIILSPLTPEKLHAKVILTDARFAYVGSINFSSFSLDYNREIGLIFTDSHIVSALVKSFRSDL